MNLLEHRKANGLTQDDVATALGVTAACVGKWETGERVPRKKNMDLIMEWLGGKITPADFYPDVVADVTGGVDPSNVSAANDQTVEKPQITSPATSVARRFFRRLFGAAALYPSMMGRRFGGPNKNSKPKPEKAHKKWSET